MAMLSDPTTLCRVCTVKASKYTCPRCHLTYCSLPCYQDTSHAKCSEEFYKGQVLNELKHKDISEAEKERMMELLKNFEEECAADDEAAAQDAASLHLAARLEGVDLDGDPQKIWEALTEAERNEFVAMVKEHKLSAIIQPWIPWWSYKKCHHPLVTEINENDHEEDLSEFHFPPIKTSIAPFSTILRTKPPDILKYNALNITLAYTLVALQYNGDHQSMAIQCAEDLVSLSNVLLSSFNARTVEDAVYAVLEAVRKLDDLFISVSHFADVIDETIKILKGAEAAVTCDYLLMAFSDMVLLLSNAHKCLRAEKESTSSRQLLLKIKKLDFYLSWIVACGVDELCPLIPEIMNVKDVLVATDALRVLHNTPRTEQQGSKPHKEPLIQEVSSARN